MIAKVTRSLMVSLTEAEIRSCATELARVTGFASGARGREEGRYVRFQEPDRPLRGRLPSPRTEGHDQARAPGYRLRMESG